jgi:hypothetical protein
MDVLFSPRQEGRSERVLDGIEKVARSTPFVKEAQELMEKRAEQNAGVIVNELRKRIGELALKKLAAEDATHKAYGVIRDSAKNHILLEGGQLQDLMKYACCAFPKMSKVWLQVFTQVKDDLTKLGHPVDKKILAQKVEMPGGTWEVINGAHGFQVELDTFRKKISETDSVRGAIQMLNDCPDPVEVGTHSFLDNMDTEQYLMSEIENLSKKASAMADEDLFLKVAEIRKLAAAAKPAAKPSSPLGKAWGATKAVGGIGGGLPLLAMLLAGPTILKAVGRGFGRAFSREGRGGYSPEAAVQGPPAPRGSPHHSKCRGSHVSFRKIRLSLQ